MAPVEYTKVRYIKNDAMRVARPSKTHIGQESEALSASQEGIAAMTKPFQTIHSQK